MNARFLQREARTIFDLFELPLHSLHSLRHSFAMNLVNSGAPLQVVQTALGHENINNTAIYLRPTTEAVAESILKSYN